MNTRILRFTAALPLAAIALGGCGDEAGAGSVAFTTWGEEYIEQEIPAADLEDGFSVTYQKFLFVIRGVTVADRDGEVGAAMAGSTLFDHTKAGTKPVASFDDLGAKPWERVSYEIGPADAATAIEGATEEDKALMLDAGASVHIEATVRKGDMEKRLDWTFSAATLYADCKGEKDGKETEGVLVTNGGTDTVELTVHGDHFFYDDLQAAEAKRRFAAIAAADADGDGEVTLEELAAVSLAAIPAEQGAYGTGSAGDVNDLRGFVTALSRTLGHFRGEGECVSRDP